MSMIQPWIGVVALGLTPHLAQAAAEECSAFDSDFTPTELRDIPDGLRQSAELRDVATLLTIARTVESSSQRQEVQWRAACWYLHAADAGDDTAWPWIERAAKGGNAAAQNLVGESLSVRGQSQQAFPWYQRSALQNYVPAMATLGQAYLQGDGAPQDETQALKWLGQAARAGNVSAFESLGVAYMRRDPTDSNECRAFFFLSVGRRLGSSFAGMELSKHPAWETACVQMRARALAWNVGDPIPQDPAAKE